jgi:hypothetical protein
MQMDVIIALGFVALYIIFEALFFEEIDAKNFESH